MFHVVIKKKADHHRHILRLPTFVNKAFKKMKTFFSRQSLQSWQYWHSWQSRQKIFTRANIVFSGSSIGKHRVKKRIYLEKKILLSIF